jgi:hypothetical protein
MQKVFALAALLLVVVVLSVSPAMAVSAQSNGLPFDNMGQAAYDSARQVWIPVIVVLGLIGLGAAFIFALSRLAGFAVRTAIGLGVLAVAATGTGLTTLFPGLITAVTLH